MVGWPTIPVRETSTVNVVDVTPPAQSGTTLLHRQECIKWTAKSGLDPLIVPTNERWVVDSITLYAHQDISESLTPELTVNGNVLGVLVPKITFHSALTGARDEYQWYYYGHSFVGVAAQAQMSGIPTEYAVIAMPTPFIMDGGDQLVVQWHQGAPGNVNPPAGWVWLLDRQKVES